MRGTGNEDIFTNKLMGKNKSFLPLKIDMFI